MGGTVYGARRLAQCGPPCRRADFLCFGGVPSFVYHLYKKWEKTFLHNPPYFQWFVGGKLNITQNCLDRNLEKRKHFAGYVAMIERGDLLTERYSSEKLLQMAGLGKYVQQIPRLKNLSRPRGIYRDSNL